MQLLAAWQFTILRASAGFADVFEQGKDAANRVQCLMEAWLEMWLN